MKLHWGHGIYGTYAIFALGMLSMAYQSTKHYPGLVAKDYYDLDLKYQSRMEATKNSQALTVAPGMQYLATESRLELSFPTDIGTPSGKVKLYCPSDAGSDKIFEIAPSADGKMSIPVTGLKSGFWRIELLWNASGKPYYSQFPVFFQNS